MDKGIQLSKSISKIIRVYNIMKDMKRFKVSDITVRSNLRRRQVELIIQLFIYMQIIEKDDRYYNFKQSIINKENYI